jgi:thymidylate kinase
MVRPRTTITLSGIVGAGKSSAAKAIVHALRSKGLRAEHIRFQAFIALGRGKRSSSGAANGNPPLAREETRTRWETYDRRRLTPGIAAGYVARTLLFRARLRRWPTDTVLVFDRYFYDSLVHFDLEAGGRPLKVLMQAIPEPTTAALLLIRPATMLERRSHYSGEYVRQATASYAALPQWFPDLHVLQSDDFASVTDVSDEIVANVLSKTRRGTGE